MLRSIILQNKVIQPAIFLAPMAGITHSAFRRLIADFGGYGAMYTEMLSGKAILHENTVKSPYTKKREHEGRVVYQLLLNGHEAIEPIVKKISDLSPFGIDLNLGCPAPKIRNRQAGTELFSNIMYLAKVLEGLRKHWHGILTVKCRLGQNPLQWIQDFQKRIVLFEEFHIDAIIVHARYSKEKLRGRAHWDLFQPISELTHIPIIGNGDMQSWTQIQNQKKVLKPLSGLMIGRMAVVKPWIFREINEIMFQTSLKQSPQTVDYTKTWETFYHYTLDDFSPEKAIGRIKEFTSYFACNFFFGHDFYSRIQGSKTLQQVYDRAMSFLTKKPILCQNASRKCF